MRAKRANPRQASQVVAKGDGLRVYIARPAALRVLRSLLRVLRDLELYHDDCFSKKPTEETCSQ